MLNKDEAKKGDGENEDGDLVKADEAAQSPLQHKFLVKGHFDAIRGMHYCQAM